jgi:SAM-dependent methyltransferase
VGPDLSAEYESQERWRRWDQALARVPVQAGQRVLDLGCGVGQIAARFHALGAHVIGVDANADLLSFAQARHPQTRFESRDLRELRPESFGLVDGIWASFVAAYLPPLHATINLWAKCLAPGGWMALVEMDDLFGHEPMPPAMRAEVLAFYASTRDRYDFACGRRLADAVERAGLTLLEESTLGDDELSFQGPAPDDVLAAWCLRLHRMAGPRAFWGDRVAEFERALLGSLASAEHRSATRVVTVVAQRVGGNR